MQYNYIYYTNTTVKYKSSKHVFSRDGYTRFGSSYVAMKFIPNRSVFRTYLLKRWCKCLSQMTKDNNFFCTVEYAVFGTYNSRSNKQKWLYNVIITKINYSRTNETLSTTILKLSSIPRWYQSFFETVENSFVQKCSQISLKLLRLNNVFG